MIYLNTIAMIWIGEHNVDLMVYVLHNWIEEFAHLFTVSHKINGMIRSKFPWA